MSKYVIVGASAAGIGAVEAIREVDPVGTITVISEESCPQYSRPMISDLVSGKADFEKMKCREGKFWENTQVQALTGRTAVRLDLTEKFVVLDRGDRVNFEKLLIATGGRPFVPKIEGTDKEGVFTFTTIADAEHLAAKLQTTKTAVVIGAGLIGVSVTEALVKRGIKVTLVELQDKILSLLLDEKGSDIVENVIKKAGVTIITGQSVQQITGRPENSCVVGGVVLTKGEQIPCDVVIIAIGVIPRIELVTGTQVKTNRGIVVDNFMQTNVPGVYASGDVAEAYDFVLNQNRLLPLWPLAVHEGKVAGYNMAGKKTDYEGGTNMSALKYFGVPIVSIGIANPKEEAAYEVLVKHKPERNLYKKLVLKDNVIMGITLVNDIERAGILFHLMKNRVNVKKIKQALLQEDFGIATLPRSLRRKVYPGEIE
ncbi:NAD(P)/FAD-dependent oxidoreductase [Candidatus Bathyarchaeota archaeon A05DMB-2]|jgi:NAD(P)H-nitrite reductase large subunit|nr:NAD(P)/FAD-dependent oxidoreductase [Candidatus Bathyarchaeota archaeon A05DMB-2]